MTLKPRKPIDYRWIAVLIAILLFVAVLILSSEHSDDKKRLDNIPALR